MTGNAPDALAQVLASFAGLTDAQHRALARVERMAATPASVYAHDPGLLCTDLADLAELLEPTDHADPQPR